MLEVEKISQFYNNRRILKNITCKFKKKTFYAITGKSGTGKTTLLSLLSGIEKPTFGSISYLGNDVSQLELSSYLRENSIVFQQFNLIDYLTAKENVCIALDIKKKVTIKK